MIIWPELDLCVFDSTAPHLYEPVRETDEVIDMYAACVKPGTDEEYACILADISASYAKTVKCGTAYLQEAKRYQDYLHMLYSGFFIPEKAQRLCEALLGG